MADRPTGMKMRGLIAAAMIAFAPGAAHAQSAGPKNCFTAPEMTAEQIVRYGLTLREGAAICSKTPWDYGLYPLWLDIDQKLGRNFATSKAARERAFKRVFGESATQRLELWDARVVFHYRYYPASEEFCGDMRKNLEAIQKGGWPAVGRRAAIYRDNVRLNFRACE